MNKSILLIKRLNIHNANAHSSPYSIGFPAMTAWLGAVHALQRKLRRDSRFDDLDELVFPSAGVVCHDFNLHAYRDTDYKSKLILAKAPKVPKRKRKKGEPWEIFTDAPFIPEARCDLTVSLILEYDTDDDADLIEAVVQNLPTLKIAAGDIQPFLSDQISIWQIRTEQDYHALVGELMPGFCLVERRDIMQQAMEDGQDALDALIDAVKITHHCEIDENEKVHWHSARQQKGWLVPIATGFQGISELGHAELQRDSDTPHRFAESIVTLAEFIMPYRLNSLEQMLWHYQADLDNNLYICKQS